MTANRRALEGSWVHAHEEDSEDELVFRPATYSLPPSRGRRAIELRSGGRFNERSPGPTDAPEDSSGKWSLEDDRLCLSPADGPEEVWEVASANPDRLALKRPHS